MRRLSRLSVGREDAKTMYGSRVPETREPEDDHDFSSGSSCKGRFTIRQVVRE